jgi:hypothetical protein
MPASGRMFADLADPLPSLGGEARVKVPDEASEI